MSYGVSFTDLDRRAATYVAKIHTEHKTRFGPPFGGGSPIGAGSSRLRWPGFGGSGGSFIGGFFLLAGGFIGGFFDGGSFLSISVRPISCKSTGLQPPATEVVITGGAG
jgi:hypothetical protein